MKVILRAEGDRLVITDDESRDVLSKIKRGSEVMVDIKRPRRIRHHRLFFGILKFMVETVGAFENVKQAKLAIKVATGEVDAMIDAATGKTFFIPRSMSFDDMPQGEFAAFFDRATEVITTRWMPPGTALEDVRREIIAMCDGPMMAGIEDHRRK